MSGYTKLFGSIVASTIWRADDKTRIVWITMLAMSDRDGVVEGSIPGLADLARVSIEDCKHALDNLQKPDEYSRTPDHEGRRIEPIDGGWLILNRAKYRDYDPDEQRRERDRERQRRHRDKSRYVTQCHALSHKEEKEKETKKEEKQIPGGPSIIFRIARAHPKLSHLRDELEIPHAAVDAIIQAIEKDGEQAVYVGTRAYGESLDDPKYAVDPYKFFSEFMYRRNWNAKPVGKYTQLLSTVSEPYSEPGEQFGTARDR